MFVLKNITRLFFILVLTAALVAGFALFCRGLPGISGSNGSGKLTVSQAVHMLTEIDEHEIIEELYYRLLDEEGNLVTVTGRKIRPGDRYLDEQNNLYEVYRVDDYTAYARHLITKRKEGLVSESEQLSSSITAAAERSKLVALYHTHNAESYVPSDGTHSIYGYGGIHQVGRVFKEALEEKDINAIHSEQLHLPHDRGAYRRSRNTVLEILQHDPDVIFDLHRDAAPIEEYSVEIEGEWVAQVQFVVGRQNPSFPVTKQFAYDLKGLADEIYPGLVKGVFMGWGNYNQDLMPLKLLLEAGGYQNSRDAAKDGIKLFADVVALYFYGIPVEEEDEDGDAAIRPPAGDIEGTQTAAAETLLGIILLVAAGAGGFYLVNNPEAGERLKVKLKEKGRYIYSNIRFMVERIWEKRK